MMNSQIHIVIETKTLKSLKEEAQEKNITTSELCRLKITRCSQLENLETKLDLIIKRIDAKNANE